MKFTSYKKHKTHKHWWKYGEKKSILSNHHEEQRQFWKHKRAQPGTNCPVSVYNIMPAWSSLLPPCDDICLFCTNFLSSAHYIFHFHLFLPLCVCVSEYILMWPCFMHWRKGAGAASIVLQFSASDEEIKVYSFAPPASPYFYSCAPNKTNRSNYIYINKIEKER